VFTVVDFVTEFTELYSVHNILVLWRYVLMDWRYDSCCDRWRPCNIFM